MTKQYVMFQTIRKNATKQISQLIAQAKRIEATCRYSDYLTDGFHYAHVPATEEELREWMQDNYQDLVIRLWKNRDGDATECCFTLKSWSNITFTLVFIEE